MMSARSLLATLPQVPRFAAFGSLTALVLGSVLGLVLGLRAHPATAWFAVFEVGVPAGLGGAVLGAFVGLVAGIVHRPNQ